MSIVEIELVLTIYNNFTLFALKQIVVCYNKFRPVSDVCSERYWHTLPEFIADNCDVNTDTIVAILAYRSPKFVFGYFCSFFCALQKLPQIFALRKIHHKYLRYFLRSAKNTAIFFSRKYLRFYMRYMRCQKNANLCTNICTSLTILMAPYSILMAQTTCCEGGGEERTCCGRFLWVKPCNS